MHRTSRTLASTAAALLAAACSSSSGGGAPPGGVLTLTVTPLSAAADGVSTVAIHIEGSTKGPVSVSTSRGRFGNGFQAITVPATPADITLHSCDARADSGCAGSTQIRAVDAGGATGQAGVTFTSPGGGGGGCSSCSTPACQGQVCDALGHVCSSLSPSTCSVCPGGSAEICSNGQDDNCDGLADCADPQCQPVGAGAGQICDGQGHTCSPASAPGGSTCSVCSGNGGVAEAQETSCSDGRDNDCDGLADCEDPGCLNQACNPANANFQCRSSGGSVTCTDTSSLYSLVLTATRPAPYAGSSGTRLPADGSSQTVIGATLKYDGAPVPGATISFGSSLAGTTVSGAPVTDAQGRTAATFTSSANGGTSVVTATYVPAGSPGATPVAATVSIDMPLLGQIRLSSQQYSILGVRFSGYQEKSVLTFQALDSAGAAYPAGLRVTFTHDSQGGSFIGAVASCTGGFPSVCTATASTTDPSGFAQVLLTSGRVATVVSVKADATAGAIPATSTAGNIAIVGAKASGLHVAIDCTPRNVPAFTDNDCLNSYYKGPGNLVTCTASFADRFNNVLGVSTLATFKTEAGAAGPPSSTPQYDSTKPPAQQTGLGVASNFVAVNGFALPADVAPFTGEASLTYDSACGTKTHNPRDGLVTIIVSANGEEGFVDQNANGVYDPGETFIDMGEPFVDVNDSGVYESGETFIDLNGNGSYDGPNGTWDANTVIWAETRVVYTGFPAIFPAVNEQSRWLYTGDFGLLPGPTAQPTFVVAGTAPGPATSQTFGLFFADPNFNLPWPSATFALKARNGNVNAQFASLPATVDNLGMTFTKQYCDHPAPPHACNSGPAEIACQATPCFIVPRVAGCDGSTCPGFSYGARGTATITGVRAGADVVEATSTINNVSTTVLIGGTCN